MIQKVWSKRFMLSVILLVLIGGAFILSAAASKRDIVASVGGEKITKDELNEKLVERFGADMLASLIDNKVIELESKKEKVSVSSQEVDDEFAANIESYGGEEYFNYALAQSGISQEDVKNDIKQYLSIKKLLEPRIEVTEEEMQTYFDENKEDFTEEEQVKASHILVEDEATAKEVAEKLADGGDFAALAEEYSIDTDTAEEGGELGYFPKGLMKEEFDTAAFSMKVDEISDPVKTEDGFHIIQITDKKEAKEAVFEEHKDEIKEILFEEKVKNEYPIWLAEKKEAYNIKNSLE